jgi:hypothetical protein
MLRLLASIVVVAMLAVSAATLAVAEGKKKGKKGFVYSRAACIKLALQRGETGVSGRGAPSPRFIRACRLGRIPF